MFLLNPIIKYVFIASVLILGYSFWAMHERSIGYSKAKAEMAAAASAYQSQVDETANKIDTQVNSISDAAAQLQKFWSEP